MDANTLTIIGIAIAWLIYRLGILSERSGIINSLEADLSIHSIWMNGVYRVNDPDNPSWSNKSYLVYKLNTTSIDNAIARGALVFLNKDLLKDIVYYRQMIERFNQLIDNAMDFQANADIWSPENNVPSELLNRMTILTKQIHVYGIGNNDEPFRYGHYFFEKVQKGLVAERNMIFVTLIWFITNLNIYPVKRFLIKYF